MKKLLLLSALCFAAKSEVSVSLIAAPIVRFGLPVAPELIKELEKAPYIGKSSMLKQISLIVGAQANYVKKFTKWSFGGSVGALFNTERYSGLSDSGFVGGPVLFAKGKVVNSFDLFVGPSAAWHFGSNSFVRVGVNSVFALVSSQKGTVYSMKVEEIPGSSVKAFNKVFYGVMPRLSVGHEFTERFTAEFFVSYSYFFQKDYKKEVEANKQKKAPTDLEFCYNKQSYIATGLILTYKIIK